MSALTLRRRLLCLPLLAWAGCFSEMSGGVCTEEFRMYELTVLQPDGAPADGVRVIATNRRTGTPYGPCDGIVPTGIGCAMGAPGRYTVYTDAQIDETSQSGDDVTVSGTRADLAFEATLRFRSDECHVRKVAGPDTVALR